MKNNYLALSREIAHLNAAYSLLYWDLETQIPKGATPWRAETLGHFAGLVHQKTSSDSYKASLEEALRDEKNPLHIKAFQRGLIDLEKARLIPEDLVKQISEAGALAQDAWSEAKTKNDFSLFAPHLKKMIDLTKKKATLLARGGNPYDALLEEYSPGLTTKDITDLFSKLRPQIKTLLEKRKMRNLKKWSVPISVQEKICHDVVEWMGFDRTMLTQARSAHPFCLNLHPTDVRITTRYNVDEPLMSLMSTVHELGHALYENQLPTTAPGTPMMQANGMDLHESQSRIWEVCLATSKDFFIWVHQWFQKNASEHLHGLTADDLFHMASEVKPSLIRTESDPVSYGLHVMIRFEIEQKIFAEDIDVMELPKIWNAKYQELLGIQSTTDTQGILQDSHWSAGGFGYFPSYLLGTMISCQLYEQIKKSFPDLSERLQNGKMSEIKTWLKENVHQYARGMSSQEILLQSTGRHLESEPFIRFLEERFFV
ncbi:MAG: carboxypeptidase M32 [Bacteriovoracaceae bacterium]|nr:carboxypeptidase M32 [Bacteriovoracaceae bacterium]